MQPCSSTGRTKPSVSSETQIYNPCPQEVKKKKKVKVEEEKKDINRIQFNTIDKNINVSMQ